MGAFFQSYSKHTLKENDSVLANSSPFCLKSIKNKKICFINFVYKLHAVGYCIIKVYSKIISYVQGRPYFLQFQNGASKETLILVTLNVPDVQLPYLFS